MADSATAWWRGFRDSAESRRNGELIGDTAIVTGLFGLDAVHKYQAELHPVYALAVRVDTKAGRDDRERVERSTFFVRNGGNEGECGSGWIPLLPGQRDTVVEYAFTIPWLPGGEFVGLGPGTLDVRSTNPFVKGLSFRAVDRQHVLLSVPLPRPGPQGVPTLVFGEFELRWRTLPYAASTHRAPIAEVVRPVEPNKVMQKLAAAIRKDTSLRQGLEMEITALGFGPRSFGGSEYQVRYNKVLASSGDAIPFTPRTAPPSQRMPAAVIWPAVEGDQDRRTRSCAEVEKWFPEACATGPFRGLGLTVIVRDSSVEPAIRLQQEWFDLLGSPVGARLSAEIGNHTAVGGGAFTWPVPRTLFDYLNFYLTLGGAGVFSGRKAFLVWTWGAGVRVQGLSALRPIIDWRRTQGSVRMDSYFLGISVPAYTRVR